MLNKTLAFIFAFFVSLSAIAGNAPTKLSNNDEGMWLPMFVDRLNYTDMKKMGLKLTPEEIYSINNASLKDAVVVFGGFCTGEIVSDKGLILTNHHCGYDAIQMVSTVEKDYLTNGFWAKNHKEEIPIEGLWVKFLKRMEDVSAQINQELGDLKGQERMEKAQALMAQIQKETLEKEGENAVVEVKDFFEGNEFYMFVYEKFDDIRLVGTPPEAVGKYGGDTDNWMWPRHTGDFSMFRVYASKDNKPAAYAEDNVPYKPQHHLPVSLNGVKKGDYAMVMGYPGSTDRYLSSYGVEQQIDVFNPLFVEMRDARLKTWRKHMDSDPKIRLQYASKYASTANYWKYFIGQTKGLKRLNIYDKKKEEEKAFNQWVAADEARKAEFGEVDNMWKSAFANTNESKVAYVLYTQGTLGIETLKLQRSLERFAQQAFAEEVDKDALEATKEALKERIDRHFKDYNFETDKEVCAVMMAKYLEVIGREVNKNLPKPSIYGVIDEHYKGDFKAFAETAYNTSILSSKERLVAFLETPSAETLENDMLIAAAGSYFDAFLQVYGAAQAENVNIEDANRLYVKGIRMMNTEKAYYPNANFTMRLTYGSVRDYIPGDAMFYAYYTTSEGLLEKEDQANPEFALPAEVKKNVLAKNFGRYADQNGELRVAFITDNDITGGNSGSPVINGNGELIGLAFDGNWEAMSGDIAFEPELQRCINVDIRYVLWIVENVYGAKNIVDEMTLVEGKPSKGKAYEVLMPAKY